MGVQSAPTLDGGVGCVQDGGGRQEGGDHDGAQGAEDDAAQDDCPALAGAGAWLKSVSPPFVVVAKTHTQNYFVYSEYFLSFLGLLTKHCYSAMRFYLFLLSNTQRFTAEKPSKNPTTSRSSACACTNLCGARPALAQQARLAPFVWAFAAHAYVLDVHELAVLPRACFEQRMSLNLGK